MGSQPSLSLPGDSTAGVPPLLETTLPGMRYLLAQCLWKIREFVLTIARDGAHVPLQRRLELLEAMNIEVLVDLSYHPDRVPLQFLEAEFVEAALGDEMSLFEKRVVHDPVTADDPGVGIRRIRGLLQAEGLIRSDCSPGGTEHRVGVAVDVHKARVGKHLEEQPDSARVRRGLEDERPPELPGHLFVEQH